VRNHREKRDQRSENREMRDEERLGNMWLRNGQGIRQVIRQELKSGAWAQSERRAWEKQPIF
jgi:hypothetical protein